MRSRNAKHWEGRIIGIIIKVAQYIAVAGEVACSSVEKVTEGAKDGYKAVPDYKSPAYLNN